MASDIKNTEEDVDMSTCDGEKIVTMMDVLQEQEDFEEDANAVLGASDDKECTYTKGYIKRQAIYACMTCCFEAKTDPSKRAGVCLACSLMCHEKHELIELYTKRNFRCDCGNPKFNTNPCTFTSNKTELNDDNNYNQNFSGLYCTCQRPYPDPEAEVEVEMIQCTICEDWLHASHLEAQVPVNNKYSEMICKNCMEKNQFLHDYSDLAVNTDNIDIDVTNINGDETLSTITAKTENSLESTSIKNRTSIDVEMDDKNQIDDSIAGTRQNSDPQANTVEHNENSSSISNDISEEQKKPQTDQEENQMDSNQIEESQSVPDQETKSEKLIQDTLVNTKENVKDDPEIINSIKDSSTDISDSTNKNEATTPEGCKDIEKAGTQQDEKDNVDIVDNLAETTTNSEGTVGVKKQHEDKEKMEEDQILADSGDENEKSASSKDIDGSNGNNEIGETPSAGKPIEMEQEINNTIKNSSTEISHKIEITNTKETTTPGEYGDIEKPATQQDESINEDSQNTDPATNKCNIDNTDCTTEATPVDKEQESNVKEEEKSKPVKDQNSDDPSNVLEEKQELKETADTAKNDLNSKQTSETSNVATNSDCTTDSSYSNVSSEKRKFEEVNEKLDAKKPKLDATECKRPKGVKKIYKGATFWPSNFRQKLCTCQDCISMYRDLSVLYLIDPEDTVSSYESLGMEKINGKPATQYEKGLQALSSLDRIQQINALTEYNKMRDKLLDFLKSFKDRKDIVKEEDIKAFFAGMKPKREPDGVYFYR